MSWTSLVPTLLILSAVLAWWFTEPKIGRVNLIAALGVVLFCCAIIPDASRELSLFLSTSSYSAIAGPRLRLLLVNHANMLLTGAAVAWLLRRSLQTLWKPVPELISILGVDVPDPPDVSLAGIRSDAATVNWTRAPPNRPVQKFLIQVNGVVVGEVAANQEPAIVVSGLKPNHFYNVRVIAVGSNNFQAGSRVVRLRTFGQDGRPQLGNGRVPSNFVAEEHPHPAHRDNGDENGAPRSPGLALESASAPEAVPSNSRDGPNAAGSGPRRNTVTRRHSPSTASMEAPPVRSDSFIASEQSLRELTERFESIRKETEEMAALIAKEENDNKRGLDELEAEKQQKRREQKRKEEQTEKLRREVNATDRMMRNAMQRKNQKERLLKDKESERLKFHDDMAKWEKGIAEMRREQDGFDSQRRDLEAERDKKLESLRESNGELQRECSQLEAELKEKREQVKELEDARKKLPGGGDDAEWREKETEFKKECQQRQRALAESLIHENKLGRKLDEQLRILSIQVGHIPGARPGYGIYTQTNSSGIDFDSASLSQLKKRGRDRNSAPNMPAVSPLPPYSQAELPVQADLPIHGPLGFSASRSSLTQSFAQGPFMDLSADMPPPLDEAAIRAISAPLSPSATALLPSNILDDFDDFDEDEDDEDEDEDEMPGTGVGPEALPQHGGSPDNSPRSPTSSNGSASMSLSSPRGSSHDLPFSSLGPDIGDQRSAHAADPMTSPASPGHSTNRLSSFFSFQRSRTLKGIDESGPALGTLKQGQSQSFPRQTGELDALANRRRTSLSGTWNVFNRNSVGPGNPETQVTGPKGFLARTLNPFSNSNTKSSSAIFSDRDTSSPRPASIASSDFPRPSTEGGSIWGPPPAEGSALGKASRIWSPEVTWSRNPSRRPSLHGSPSVLETTLASAEDEILEEGTQPNVSQVGVIGSRPPTASNSFARLNPNAPAFIGSLFRVKPDKDKDGSREKERGKGREKGRPKDKGREAAAVDGGGGGGGAGLTSDADSPAESRRSRDGLSMHTRTSVSEPRESLSLDRQPSNTPSESTGYTMSSSFKDDNVVRKLFRKGSSSKFSLPGRLGGKDGSMFSSKKGPSSTTSTGTLEKGISAERASMGDLEDMAENGSALFGRSYDSSIGSASLGPALSNVPTNPRSVKEGKTGGARWLSFSKKGKKEKESLDLDRDRLLETEELPDDGENPQGPSS